MFATAAQAATIRDISTKPSNVDPTDGKFTIEVELGGTTCGNQIRIYVDGEEFDSRNLGCERDDIESDEWDLVKNPLSCGTHEIKVEIVDGGVVTQTRLYDLALGNVPDITLDPERPVPGKATTITLTDPETGNPAKGVNTQIYYVRDGESSADTYSTDSKGEIEFSTDTRGQYRMLIQDRDYCGEFDFWVKKTMPFAGPNPEDPVVGERIGVAVPGGVGVKYIDSDGNVYPMMNMGGGVNITIDEAGDYTLVAGELSTVYWSVVKNFTVSERARMSAEIEPELGVVDKVVKITVKSRGDAVSDTPIKITKPLGGSEVLETNSQGEVMFTPEAPGVYYYEVEKERYETLEGSFEAHNSFSISIEPREPISNQDIKMVLKDQRGDPVTDAIVYIEDDSEIIVTESTDLEGSFVFRLDEPGKYGVKIEKEGFWTLEQEIQAYGEIAMKLSSEEIEIGEDISISVTNIENQETVATITATKPNGRTETISKSYSPPDVGEYTITATKPDFRTVESTLVVKPHPLDIAERIEGDQLIVTATSNGEAVAGLTFMLKTPSEEKQGVTDESGRVYALVEESGNLSVSANNIDQNDEYENRTYSRKVVKQYNYLLLIGPILVVLVLTALVVAGIDFLHKRSTEGAKSSGGLFDDRKGKGSGRKSLSGL